MTDEEAGEYHRAHSNDGASSIAQLRQYFVTALVYLEKTDLRDRILYKFTLREALDQDWANSRLVGFWDDLLYRLRGWREWLAR